ncbi:MAG: aminotransferase class I/II-fold pyridoxal phosphate-dependent enzyme [Crocinitomicaceae bacterium]|nr:aminotransferase class I/II-fold pyridoxal phosphate-dependent enzyme [Crocinitomicaceae bacterium]
MDKKLHKKLQDRREKGTLRSLSSFDGMIDFASNDYLGFSKNNLLHSDLSEQGATGSRLISGNRNTIEEVESKLASFFDAEAALCFNSGYDANIGVFSSIPQRGDIILYDEFIHASARDGIRLSLAKSYGFKHNNLNDLKRLLDLNKEQTVYIAVESLYSMHGDLCPLDQIVELAEQHSAFLILDEAHSAGIFGTSGRGFAQAHGVHSKCFLRLVTFGKAFGTHGSVVLCSGELREFLVNFARSFIYTTALPVSAYHKMLKAVEQESIDELAARLQSRIAYFRKNLTDFNLSAASNSPIQFIKFSNLDQLREAEQALLDAGIFAKAIYAPTVPEGSEGLRVSLHDFNSEKEIDALIRIISA